MRTGTVYTETVVHLSAEAFAKDVPYQTAIVTLDGGSPARLTGRILGRTCGDRRPRGGSGARGGRTAHHLEHRRRGVFSESVIP